jgi:hypothetical protein
LRDELFENIVLDRAAQLIERSRLCFSAAARYMAQMIAAGELIVMLVDTLSSGMPSNRISMSFSEEIATPHLPNSPSASG